MYIGDSMEIAPTAKPPTNRAAARITAVGATPQATDVPAKSKETRIIIFLRPH
jgi:hypothetical protein